MFVMPRPISALIHTEALAHNLKRARLAAPQAKAWAVVKANAYGHGVARAYPGLQGADGFALLDIAEARGIPLRGALAASPHLTDTLMLNGERTPIAEHAGHVLRDGDELYLLAPLAGG